jgi:hypothetical protein
MRMRKLPTLPLVARLPGLPRPTFLRPVVSCGLVLAMLVAGAITGHGQRLDLEWQVRATRGFLDAGAQAVFSPAPEIELQVLIGNSERAENWVTIDPGFFSALVIQLVDVDTESIAASGTRWLDEGTCGGGHIGACSLLLRTSLPPGGWMRATTMLLPLAGDHIPEGRYHISLDFALARKLLRGADNEQWRGRLHERGTIPLVVRTVATPNDRREYYRIEGTAARARGDLARSLQLYEAWAAEFPDEAGGYGSAGVILFELGRFEQAATMLERALSFRQFGSTALPEWLAAAYVGMGHEERAISMLQRHRGPNATPEIMERAQREVSRVTGQR